MYKRILVLVFACNLQFHLTAQDNLLNSKRYIEVTGTSETEITPDELSVTITLQERSEKNEKISIDKQEAELKKNIKELGIDLSQLTLSTADADYRRLRTFKKDVLISKSYILKLSNAEMLSKLYERLDKMNAHDAYISKYTHSRILEIQKENRIKAVKAAKDKAEYLLTAVGQQAGLPIQITETENYVQDGPEYPYRMNKMVMNTMAMEQGDA